MSLCVLQSWQNCTTICKCSYQPAHMAILVSLFSLSTSVKLVLFMDVSVTFPQLTLNKNIQSIAHCSLYCWMLQSQNNRQTIYLFQQNRKYLHWKVMFLFYALFWGKLLFSCFIAFNIENHKTQKPLIYNVRL